MTTSPHNAAHAGSPAAAKIVHGINVGRVEAAIRSAELRTSAELRVAISRFYFWGDVRRAAAATFTRLHMNRTRHRNAVLLFVAPRRRQFAVIGDDAAHAHVTASFWTDVADQLGHAFRAGELTGGLEQAIAAIGARLGERFPPDPDGQNELPDQVVV